MLKRIYIDNYKSCVDFSLEFGAINLLMGVNGSGKSTVFEVLRNIRDFVADGRTIKHFFQKPTLTRWQSSHIQNFNLEIERLEDGTTYRYELGIEYGQEDNQTYVKHERLFCDSQPLITYTSSSPDDTYMTVYDNATYEEISSTPYISTGSVLSTLPERTDTVKATWFKERLARFIIVQITPQSIWEEAEKESPQLSQNAHNFVDWYRHISHDQDFVKAINAEISEIYEEFSGFELKKTGEHHRMLWSKFRENGHHVGYRFSELSEGQRVLIVLYTIIHYARTKDYTLCIDEPGNYMSLREIQPWIAQLAEFCDDDQLQALIISHHPELINYLVFRKAGIWLSRESLSSPTKAKPFPDQSTIRIPVAELVARGWVDDE